MDSEIPNLQRTLNYFQERLTSFGATPRGVDWNSETAQEVRFSQLINICPREQPFSLLDYGCGYGALADFLLKRGYPLDRYVGFDILAEMVDQARGLHSELKEASFTSDPSQLTPVDYAIASGIFNIRLETPEEAWTSYVTSVLHQLDHLGQKGFSFNMLTKYSDPEYMKPQLYYADPCFFFDYCKRNFSRNVALLHDYEIYDFTILVRK